MNFEQLLKFGVDQGASAIHLQAEGLPTTAYRGADPQRRRPSSESRRAEGVHRVDRPQVGRRRHRKVTRRRIDLLDIDRARPVPLYHLQSDRRAGRRAASGFVDDPECRGTETCHGPSARSRSASRGLTLVVGPSGSGNWFFFFFSVLG